MHPALEGAVDAALAQQVGAGVTQPVAGKLPNGVAEARDEGLIRFLGITGHHCDVLRQALERYDFDTVMLPVNPSQATAMAPPWPVSRP